MAYSEQSGPEPAGTRQGSPGFLRLGPLPTSVLAGGLVLTEIVLLRALSLGRYYPALPASDNGAPLLWVHTVSKGLVLAFVLLFALSALRRGAALPRISSPRARRALLSINVAAFLGLLLVLPILPTEAPASGSLPAPHVAAYLASSVFLATLALSGAALVAPRHLRLGRTAIAYGALLLAAAIHLGQLTWAVAWTRSLVEGATLDLSLWFYGLSGRPMPVVDFALPNPLMASPGFAISIAPSCSGYQGMISAFLLLGAYLGLEWRHLRLRRALIICLAAIAGTFVLNGLRIALLFYIGDAISPEIAVGGFHSQFGVLALLTTSGLAILAMETGPFRRNVSAAEPAQGPLPIEFNHIAILMLPLAVYLLAGMIAGLFTGTFNWLYPIPVIAGSLVLWSLRHRLWADIARHPSLLSIPVGIVVYLAWIALVPADEIRGDVIGGTLAAAPTWLAAVWIFFRVVGSCVVVPIVEELAFRGGLIRLLEAIAPGWLRGPALAVFVLAVSSLAFGLLHSDILAATLAGVAYGALYLHRRTLSDAIIAHGVTNFLICLHVLGMGQWSYW